MGKIEKDQIRLSSPVTWLKFQYKRGRGHLLAYLKNRLKWHTYPRFGVVDDYPLHVDVELASACDMTCPMCYTVTDLFKRRVNRTRMTFDLFKKIVDESAAHDLYSIRLSLRGEAFLNPHIVEMMRYAKGKGIKEVSTLTNAMKLTPEKFEAAMEAGLDWLTISVDGWGETYNNIRKPAKFEETYAKIREFAAIKRRRNSRKPVIKVQSVWPAIKEDPGYFYGLFRPYVDEVTSNPLIDFLREDTNVQYKERFTCPYVWQRMSIGADGHVLMCQSDEMDEHLVGDATKESLYAIWHSPEYRRIRDIHRRHRGVAELEPCKHCCYPRVTEAASDAKVEERLIQIPRYVGRADRIARKERV